ncbi:MAG: TrbI/VirB10 family protein [Verrucomicrobiia bacterium]
MVNNQVIEAEQPSTKAAYQSFETDIPTTTNPGKTSGITNSQCACFTASTHSHENFVSNEEFVSENFVPFGRFIPCELINTVDSAQINTPIVGLVTEDVWQNGKLIIAAGTEVHGTANLDRSRERISSQENWTLVFQDGKQIQTSGIALDQSKESDGWSITDGSAGLKGYLIKSDKLAEVKALFATFVSGAAGGLVEVQENESRSGVLRRNYGGTLKDALGKGFEQAGELYAQRVLETIEKEGFYVRVPAGTTFYLYTTQLIDKNKFAVTATTRKEAL